MANYLTLHAMDWPQAEANADTSNRCERFNRDCRERILAVYAHVEERPFKGRVTDMVKKRLSAPVVALECALRLKPKSMLSKAALKRRSSTVLLKTEMADTGRFHVTIVRG